MKTRNMKALTHTIAAMDKRNAEAKAERERTAEVERAVEIFEKAKAEIEALGCRIDVAADDDIGVFSGSREDLEKYAAEQWAKPWAQEQLRKIRNAKPLKVVELSSRIEGIVEIRHELTSGDYQGMIEAVIAQALDWQEPAQPKIGKAA